jgi:transcriptional regulator with XRE-family HTH domain
MLKIEPMITLLPLEKILQTLGERVRVLRLAQNVSQAELASRCGVSLSSIRRFEASGQATLELMVKVAHALHAAQGLEELLVSKPQTIAELEQRSLAQSRQRARKAKLKNKTNAGVV